MEMKAQVVIVGGGLAGFSAAMEIAEAGGEALLLEKMAESGGSTSKSGGCFAFAGTDLQEKQGIRDSAELLFKDLREVGQMENDETLVRAYVDHQAETYQWLLRQGAEFVPAIEASSGMSVPRVHTLDPAELVRKLEARCRATGKVAIRKGAAAERLVCDANGRVTGVAGTLGGKAFAASAARGVLLASGGFAKNGALVHRFVPHYKHAVFISGEGNVGDGLKMAWKLGADFRDMCYIKGTYGKHPTDETNDHSCLFVYKGAIAVNQDGRRYVDESASYKLLGDACMAQEFGATFQILDQDVFEQGDNTCRILDFERRFEEGLVIQAPTLERLAAMIEVPVGTLQDTVTRYNGYVDAGHDPDFGRKHLVHNHGELRRIERGPFYAYPSTAAVYSTYCGLCVDDHMRVLDVFGQWIPGLHAAGEIVGGLHGAAYMTGSALGKAAIFGRIAGRSVLGGVS